MPQDAVLAPTATPPDEDWAIRCEGLGKRYKLYGNPWRRAAEWATLNRVCLHREFWALRGVSFDVPRGRCLGVVGRNGSGKSTLLKVLTGVSVASEGTSSMRGRVLSLIELGAGLNQDLTGRQNVFNMSRLLNFPPGFAREKIEEIESFADIGSFFDRPVRTYSSGMRVRLTFSMFAAFEPDVLVVDEALSVGDVFFVQKCSRRIRELLDAGTTLLLVSHDAGAITTLCDRAILLEQGRVAFDGEPTDAIARYHATLRGGKRWEPPARKREQSDQPASQPDAAARAQRRGRGLASEVLAGDIIGPDARHSRRHGEGGASVLACQVLDREGRPATVLDVGSTITIRLLVGANAHLHAPRAGVRLFDRFDVQVFGQGTAQLGVDFPPMDAGHRAVVSFVLTLDVRPGEYTLGVSVSEPPTDGNPNGAVFHDHINGLGPIRVRHPVDATLPFFGVARLPMRAEVTPAGVAEGAAAGA